MWFNDWIFIHKFRCLNWKMEYDRTDQRHNGAVFISDSLHIFVIQEHCFFFPIYKLRSCVFLLICQPKTLHLLSYLSTKTEHISCYLSAKKTLHFASTLSAEGTASFKLFVRQRHCIFLLIFQPRTVLSF